MDRRDHGKGAMSDQRHDPQQDATEPKTGRTPPAQPARPGGSVAGLGYTGADDAQEDPEPAEDGVEGLGYTGREPAKDEDEDLTRPL
jgi:hypothetical protein